MSQNTFIATQIQRSSFESEKDTHLCICHVEIISNRLIHMWAFFYCYSNSFATPASKSGADHRQEIAQNVPHCFIGSAPRKWKKSISNQMPSVRFDRRQQWYTIELLFFFYFFMFYCLGDASHIFIIAYRNWKYTVYGECVHIAQTHTPVHTHTHIHTRTCCRTVGKINVLL